MQQRLRPSDMMDLLVRLDQEASRNWSVKYTPVDSYKERFTSLQTQMMQERKQHALLLRYYRTVLIGLCGLVGMISTVFWLVLTRSNDTKS